MSLDNTKNSIAARMTKEQKERKEAMFKTILKKTGMSYSEFLMMVKHNFVAKNLDSLTAEERKRFNVKA